MITISFTSLNRFLNVLSSKFNNHDISVMNNDIEEILKLEKQVQLLKDKLVKDKKERIMGDDGVVKRWAAKEQEPYNRNSLKSCEQLIGKIQYNICA